MRKHRPPTCPAMQHKFVAHQETQTTGYWYTYQSKTLLFCEKCGLHFYVDKTPADYASGDSTWAYTDPAIARTTATQLPTTGLLNVTYGGGKHFT